MQQIPLYIKLGTKRKVLLKLRVTRTLKSLGARRPWGRGAAPIALVPKLDRLLAAREQRLVLGMRPRPMVALLCLLMLCFAGCTKFLTKHPGDLLLDDDVYKSEAGVYNVLNGLYEQMAYPGVYGENLTQTTLDIMGQYYAPGAYAHSALAAGSYQAAHELYDSIWTGGYSVILQANVFMDRVRQIMDPTVLTEAQKADCLGEALAIRALLHFDLLRCYAPVYKTDSTARGLVYNNATVPLVLPRLPINQIMDSIWRDLVQAEGYLQNDLVRVSGGRQTAGSAGGVLEGADYYSLNRTMRLNYYAVKLLEARVALYRKDALTAGRLARELIQEIDEKGFFKWSDVAATSEGSLRADPLFSSELILGLYDKDLYNSYRSYFAPSVQQYYSLQPSLVGLGHFYEDDPQSPVDDRLRTQWGTDPSAINKGYTFKKYAPAAASAGYVNILPLMRKSELYYIAAEAFKDGSYLDSVRLHRGLGALSVAPALLQQEIEKEYRKEFWGEGQLFFYYKRMGQLSVPTTLSSSSTTNFNERRYSLPIPAAELIGH